MTGARPGLVVYAKDVASVSRLYEAVVGLEVVEETVGHVALASDAIEGDVVLLREMPGRTQRG